MFSIKNKSIEVQQRRVRGVIKRLPAAHVVAQHAAVSHMHQSAVQAVNDAGFNTAPLGMFSQRGRMVIGIDDSPEGDALANVEYGTYDSPPNPVIRTAMRAAHPHATVVYNKVIRQEAGF